eukprot:superscaffoldBa00000527_g5417
MLFSPHRRGRRVIGHAKGAQTCTCRGLVGSSLSVGEGVPPSSDAGVTGEVAMFPRSVSHSQLLLVTLSAVSSSIQPRSPLLLREDR